MRLDAHLNEYGKRGGGASTTVTEAYDLFHHSAAVNAKRKEQTEAMRREATVLFQHLFTFRSRRPTRGSNRERFQGGSSNRRANTSQSRQGSRGGLTIVDDDEEMFGDRRLESAQFDFERDFPELFPVLHHSLNHQPTSEVSGVPSVGQRSHVVKPTPRGGGSTTGRIPILNHTALSEDEPEESEQTGDVPLYDPQAGYLDESNAPAEQERAETDDSQGMGEVTATIVTETSTKSDGDDDEMRRREFELQLRKQQTSNRVQHPSGSGSNSSSHVNRKKPPSRRPKPQSEPSPAANEEVPQVSKVETTKEVQIREQNVHQAPSSRRMIDPKTFKGPCATSLLLTLALVGAVIGILILWFPDGLPMSEIEEHV